MSVDTATVQKYIPEGYSEPTTVKEALIVGRAILVEEDRWVRGRLFTNPHPEVDETTPFCNSWGVCALGAIGACLLGVGKFVSECTCVECQERWDIDLRSDDRYLTPDRERYEEAAEALNTATEQLFGGDGLRYIVSLNDKEDSTLEDVLTAFDRAIENAS